MDAAKFEKYRGDIQRGDPEGSTKFESIIQRLAQDPKIREMPEDAQDRILAKIADRYKQQAIQAEKPIGILKGEKGAKGEGGDSPINISTGAGTASSLQIPGGFAKDFGSGMLQKVGLNAGMGAYAASKLGLPMGVGVQAALSPGNLMTMGLGSAVDAGVNALGYGGGNLLERVAPSVLTSFLTMVNPPLGMAAKLLGKPIADLAMDFMDVRKNETTRDQLEDAFGKISGMQMNKEYLDGMEETDRSKKAKDTSTLLQAKIDDMSDSMRSLSSAKDRESALEELSKKQESLQKVAKVASMYDKKVAVNDPEYKEAMKTAQANAGKDRVSMLQNEWRATDTAKASAVKAAQKSSSSGGSDRYDPVKAGVSYSSGGKSYYSGDYSSHYADRSGGSDGNSSTGRSSGGSFGDRTSSPGGMGGV